MSQAKRIGRMPVFVQADTNDGDATGDGRNLRCDGRGIAGAVWLVAVPSEIDVMPCLARQAPGRVASCRSLAKHGRPTIAVCPAVVHGRTVGKCPPHLATRER